MEAALALRDGALARCEVALGEGAEALDRQQRRIAELEGVCDRLSARVVAGERELERARSELGRLHEQGEQRLRELTTLATELEAVRSQARGQATRIRLRALRDAAEISERITELTRRPAEARERLLEALQTAIARIGAEAEAEDSDEGPAALDPDAGGRALRSADELFEGLIEIEVGPLADFSQLVGFEDAAGGIVATSEISVKRFAQGRATLEMKLAEPVELLRELEQRSPFEFRVRERRFDRLVLDVEAAQAA